MLKKTALKIHFTLLTIIVLNYVLNTVFRISLTNPIEVVIKIIIVLSGLTLFAMNLKPFKTINLYFSVYAISLILLIYFLVFRGIFGAIVASIVLYPIYPDVVEFRKDDIIIYNKYQGFMSRCCSYKITESRFFIFEKDYGTFNSDEGQIDFKLSKLTKVNNGIELKYISNYHQEDKTIRFENE